MREREEKNFEERGEEKLHTVVVKYRDPTAFSFLIFIDKSYDMTKYVVDVTKYCINIDVLYNKNPISVIFISFSNVVCIGLQSSST
jgi:hypothetical protein